MSDEDRRAKLRVVKPEDQEPHHDLLPEELKGPLKSYELKFDWLRRLTRGLIQTDTVNAIIISGPPGIGKTFTIDGILQEQTLDPVRPITYRKKSGKITPLAFYEFLVANSTTDCISFFDDADTILTEEVSLGLLKQAAEKRRQRVISYDSTKVDVTQVPYNGKIIIATNVQYANNPHYEAVVDRFHCYDMRVTYEEKLAKLFDIVERDSQDHQIGLEVLYFLLETKKEFDPAKMTLRTFVKLKELALLMPGDWQRFARLSGTYMKK